MNYSLQNLIVPKDEKAYPQVMSNSTKDFMADTSKKYDQGSLQFSSVQLLSRVRLFVTP